MSIEFWRWTPGIAVGLFRFGSNDNDIIREHDLRKLKPDCEGAFWETYRIPGLFSSILVDEGKISDVVCWEYLCFHGYNVLDLDVDEAQSLLGPYARTENHPYVDGTQVVYYPALGLTLFVKEGKIDSATCHESEPE